MAPTLQKTWQFNVNQDLNAGASVTLTRGAVLYALKNALKGFALAPWQVRYSCNGTVAGVADDLVDRWAGASSVIFNSAAHSWIVLRQTALNVELLISCTETGAGASPTRIRAQLAVGSNWFAGGSTTVDPTSAASFSLIDSARVSGASAGYWCLGSDSSTNFNCALHVMMSSDGECTRAGVFVGGIPVMWLSIEKLRSAVTSLTYPIYATWQGDYVNAGTTGTDVPLFYEYMFDTTNPFADDPPWRAGRMYHGGAAFAVSFLTERVVTASAATRGAVGQRSTKYNQIESEYALTGVGVYSAAAGTRGRHGALYDLWCGPSDFPVGRGYPSDSAPNFVHWRNLVVPWNGTAMLTA